MIKLCFKHDELMVYVENSEETEKIEQFRNYINSVLEAENLYELFINRMKEARETGKKKSQVGLITIVKDRGAMLSWKLEKGPDITRVTTLARIPLKGGAK